MKELKIGDVMDLEGKKMECVEDLSETCTSCLFNDIDSLDACQAWEYKCLPSEREDMKKVIFVEVGTELANIESMTLEELFVELKKEAGNERAIKKNLLTLRGMSDDIFRDYGSLRIRLKNYLKFLEESKRG